jgi:hypothetical protein
MFMKTGRAGPGIRKSSCLCHQALLVSQVFRVRMMSVAIDINLAHVFVKAAKNGAAGVELDIEFTSDGVPVLMHDSTVDRTTDGSGRLCDLTFDQIRKLNPAANHRLR